MSTKFDIQVHTTQFPLHPDTPIEGLTLEELFAGRGFDLAAAAARLKQVFETEGLPYGPRTHTYNSRLAQELAKWAEGQPAGQGIHDALFKAYFVDGVNLAQVDRLVEIADRAGLDSEGARQAIDSRAFRDSVDRDWKRSAELGVTAVPTFVMDGRRVVGAQSYEVLAQLVGNPKSETRNPR